MFDASPHRELHAKVIPWIGAAENLTALQNDPLAEPGAPVRPQIASAGRLRGSFGAGRALCRHLRPTKGRYSAAESIPRPLHVCPAPQRHGPRRWGGVSAQLGPALS